LLSAVLLVACTGESLDESTLENQSSATSAEFGESRHTQAPISAPLANAQASSGCYVQDVRGPYTHFSDGVPLVALGISCPQSHSCYTSTVPHHETVVCRAPSGEVTCKDSFGTVLGRKWGYDCCVENGAVGGKGYQCYWFKAEPAITSTGSIELK
jgi:hypothetical protein